jgi:hypothetical protein
MNPLTLMVWNICAGGQYPSYDTQDKYGPTSRLNAIASEINFFAPDVVAIVDAFGWNKWPQFLFEDLFPQYRLEAIYPVGDIIDLSYAILVKSKIFKGIVTSKIQPLTNTSRNVVSLCIYETMITVAYLEDNIASKRDKELKALLQTNSDLIVGDLNTIFTNARKTFFASPANVFQHWRVLGLWLVSSLIRGMFVNPRVLTDYHWIPLVNAPTFPLPYFWEVFLKSGWKKRTSWVWSNLLFPMPVLQVDHCLQKRDGNIVPIRFQAEVVYSNGIANASDHCPIFVKIIPD